jgi:hypothetical protein
MRNSLRALCLIAATLAGGAMLLTGAGTAAGKAAQATTGVVYAGVTHAEGDDLYVSGDFKDKVLGRGGIVYVTNVSGGDEPGSVLVKARKLTIYTNHGSFSGKGQAIVTGDTVSDGVFNLTKGTGDYKGMTMKGTFDGTYADGIYTFNYKAKIK